MYIIDGLINLSLDLHSDIEVHIKSETQDRLRVYKLRMAKTIEYIIFGLYLLQYANLLLVWLFLLFYGVSIIVSIIYKFIILNGLC